MISPSTPAVDSTSGAGTEPGAPHPQRSRRPALLPSFLSALLAASLFVFAAGCANRNVIDDPDAMPPEGDSTMTAEMDTTALDSILSEEMSEMTGDQEGDTATRDTFYVTVPAGEPTSPDTSLLPPGQSLGERLGQLDALMRTAPPDSLPALREEYERLLNATAARMPRVHTGQARRNINAGSDTSTAIARREIEEPALPDSLNPARLYKGLRESELRTIPGYRRSTDSATAARQARASARLRAEAGARGRAQRRAEEYADVAPDTRPRTIHQRFIEGLAAARSGNYQEAVDKLGPVVASSDVSSESARYFYALSLERTGKTSKAAEQYRIASRSDGTLGHKSYVSYCRLLARMGQTSRARQLVLQFIQNNPDSSQIVDARRLLQSL